MNQLVNNNNNNSATNNNSNAIKDIDSNGSIHFQVIPTTSGASTAINSSPVGTNLGTANNLTIAPVVASQTITTQTSTSTASSAMHDTQQSLNFNCQHAAAANAAATGSHIVNQSAENHIGITANGAQSAILTNANHPNHPLDVGSASNLHHSHHQQHHQHHHNMVNHGRAASTAANRMVNAPIVTSTPSLVLSLSQLNHVSDPLT